MDNDTSDSKINERTALKSSDIQNTTLKRYAHGNRYQVDMGPAIVVPRNEGEPGAHENAMMEKRAKQRLHERDLQSQGLGNYPPGDIDTLINRGVFWKADNIICSMIEELNNEERDVGWAGKHAVLMENNPEYAEEFKRQLKSGEQKKLYKMFERLDNAVTALKEKVLYS